MSNSRVMTALGLLHRGREETESTCSTCFGWIAVAFFSPIFVPLRWGGELCVFLCEGVGVGYGKRVTNFECSSLVKSWSFVFVLIQSGRNLR